MTTSINSEAPKRNLSQKLVSNGQTGGRTLASLLTTRPKRPYQIESTLAKYNFNRFCSLYCANKKKWSELIYNQYAILQMKLFMSTL